MKRFCWSDQAGMSCGNRLPECGLVVSGQGSHGQGLFASQLRHQSIWTRAIPKGLVISAWSSLPAGDLCEPEMALWMLSQFLRGAT